MKQYHVSGGVLAVICCQDIIAREDCTISPEKKERLLGFINESKFEAAFYDLRDKSGGTDMMLDYALCSFVERDFLEGINHSKRCSPLWRNVFDGFQPIPFDHHHFLCDQGVVDLFVQANPDAFSWNKQIIHYIPGKWTFASQVQ